MHSHRNLPPYGLPSLNPHNGRQGIFRVFTTGESLRLLYGWELLRQLIQSDLPETKSQNLGIMQTQKPPPVPLFVSTLYQLIENKTLRILAA